MAGRHRRPRPHATTARAAGLLSVTALAIPLSSGAALADAPAAPDRPKAPSARPVTELPKTARGEGVVLEASRHEGKPYRWGAEGPNSFDCSGFTQYVYDRFGVQLPRTAHLQYLDTPRVSKSAMQRGDLVFFYDEDGFVYHVGIYAGDGDIWAATKPGDTVRTQDIWTDAYTVGRPKM